MIHLSRTAQRLSGALAGATLLLAVSGCTAASPSATFSDEPSESSAPRATTDVSSSPDENTAPAWTATGAPIAFRVDYTVTLLSDGRVLVAGGHGSTPALFASAELYDPGSGTWTATGSMAGGRYGHTATLLTDGMVLVAGGDVIPPGSKFAPPGPPVLASAELYDPGSGTWTAAAPMDGHRVGHTATLLPDGRVLVAGGGIDTLDGLRDPLASAELYDPGSATWTATENMAEARYRHTATLLPDGRVLVAGGTSGSGGVDLPLVLASAELYDPSTGSWTATGGMMQSHAGNTAQVPGAASFDEAATLLPNGRVLLAGGGVASAELYDPDSGTWTATGGMTQVRSGHTVTLLSDGTVLVAGGFGGGFGRDPVVLASAELYDPDTGTWTATRSMQEVRSGHMATLLADGNVLVVGGGVVSAELYDPGSGN